MLPGIPDSPTTAWLGGVIDRGGGFTTDPVGIKVTGPVVLCRQLYIVAGGRIYVPAAEAGPKATATWVQTRQADLRLLLPRLDPYVRVRHHELRAMIELLEHLATRKSYHGSVKWRTRREGLRAAVARARAA